MGYFDTLVAEVDSSLKNSSADYSLPIKLDDNTNTAMLVITGEANVNNALLLEKYINISELAKDSIDVQGIKNRDGMNKAVTEMNQAAYKSLFSSVVILIALNVSISDIHKLLDVTASNAKLNDSLFYMTTDTDDRLLNFGKLVLTNAGYNQLMMGFAFANKYKQKINVGDTAMDAVNRLSHEISKTLTNTALQILEYKGIEKAQEMAVWAIIYQYALFSFLEININKLINEQNNKSA